MDASPYHTCGLLAAASFLSFQTDFSLMSVPCFASLPPFKTSQTESETDWDFFWADVGWVHEHILEQHMPLLVRIWDDLMICYA